MAGTDVGVHLVMADGVGETLGSSVVILYVN